MKIRVEHESARKLSLDGLLHDNRLIDEVILDFTLELQQQNNWCWAAIATSIGNFYDNSSLSQKEIVSRLLNIDISLLPDQTDDKHISNQQRTLDESLTLVNSFSHWSLGRPSFERLLLEISAGRPVCVRIEWLEGGAHYLVIKGINPGEQLLHIEDSLHGPSVVAYNSFPKLYLGMGAIWTETFWTAPMTQHNSNNPTDSAKKPRDKDDE